MVSPIGRGFFSIGRVLGVASALVVLALTADSLKDDPRFAELMRKLGLE